MSFPQSSQMQGPWWGFLEGFEVLYIVDLLFAFVLASQKGIERAMNTSLITSIGYNDFVGGGDLADMYQSGWESLN